MSDNNLLLRLEDLVNNPTARVPVCLCLDTSGSMYGAPINELNEGVKLFFDSIREDETALYAAEVSIVTFGSEVTCIEDFANVQRQTNIPKLQANGGTPMGEAVNLALDLLEKRKTEYRDKGVDYYQPWLVLMTDGQPNGSNSELKKAIKSVNELVNSRKLTVFPIAIGDDADIDVLKLFSPKRQPLKLKGLMFREFFQWLSKSISTTSQSTPGETILLPPVNGWREL